MRLPLPLFCIVRPFPPFSPFLFGGFVGRFPNPLEHHALWLIGPANGLTGVAEVERQIEAVQLYVGGTERGPQVVGVHGAQSFGQLRRLAVHPPGV